MALSAPRPYPAFAGDFDQLRKASLQLGDFVCPYMICCKRGRTLFLCSVDQRTDNAVLGGRKRRNADPANEWLFVELNVESTTFTAFWWCDQSTFEFKLAKISSSGRGNMRSSWMNCWKVDLRVGVKADMLPVFKVLGFTFLCPIEWEALRWSGDLEVNHKGLGHHVNTFSNMEVIDKWSHRSLSGREGQSAKKRRALQVVFSKPSWMCFVGV